MQGGGLTLTLTLRTLPRPPYPAACPAGQEGPCGAVGQPLRPHWRGPADLGPAASQPHCRHPGHQLRITGRRRPAPLPGHVWGRGGRRRGRGVDRGLGGGRRSGARGVGGVQCLRHHHDLTIFFSITAVIAVLHRVITARSQHTHSTVTAYITLLYIPKNLVLIGVLLVVFKSGLQVCGGAAVGRGGRHAPRPAGRSVFWAWA